MCEKMGKIRLKKFFKKMLQEIAQQINEYMYVVIKSIFKIIQD